MFVRRGGACSAGRQLWVRCPAARPNMAHRPSGAPSRHQSV